MGADFRDYLKTIFLPNLKELGFNEYNQIDNNESFIIECHSINFFIKIEKYRREFYLTLFKFGSTKEINIFNLLNYLYRGTEFSFKSEFFKDEPDIQECYIKQLTFLKTILIDNINLISSFFNSKKIDLEFVELEKFIINKHPELFVTQKK